MTRTNTVSCDTVRDRPERPPMVAAKTSPRAAKAGGKAVRLAKIERKMLSQPGWAEMRMRSAK